ncbi:MAG: tetratricopeptide repeat protein [Alphaproteobacteria bacterium]|nr:tetratricopeptide repeat protein [Alphaproteobacteria bacterium]
MQRKLTTIVAMDVVGYSQRMERDEEGTLDRLKQIRAQIIDPAIARHSGRTVKLMGDGSLVEFSSVVDALQCALDIQRELAADNRALAVAQEMHLRIGLHLGDVIVEGADIYGDGVNIAARLETLAPPGGIVLSKQVHDHVGDKVAVAFVSLGKQSVKNINRPIEAYRIDPQDRPDPEKSGAGVIRFGQFELDTTLFELREAGQRVAVEPQAFDLLLLLVKNRERMVTKDEIFAAIWGDRIVSDAALSSQVKAARRAVGDDGASQKVISTVHGRGFRFIAPVESAGPGDVADLISDNKALAAIASQPSVAILPFVNMNRDPDEDYFADGITEDITIALARNRWLTVIARNPAFSFRGSADSIRRIGEQLDANYIVTGSVRKAGTRFRISAELVDAETEHSVWSERYDRDMVDIFELQDEISEMIAARIESELGLTEQKKAQRRPRQNRGAWDLYQLAVAQFYKFTPDSNGECQALLRQAIELDDGFASAHSRLAYAIVLSMVYFDAKPDPARMDEALRAAKRAIELDDQDANSFFTIGRVHLARQEYDLAIDALEHALELNPCLAVTYCGLGDSLAYEGRLDEAIEQFEIAIKLSPHDPFRWAFYSYRSLAHLFRGEHEDAVAWARRAVSIPNAQYWAYAHLVTALGHLGDADACRSAIGNLHQVKPEFSISFAREHLFYLKLDDQMETYIDGLKKAGIR